MGNDLKHLGTWYTERPLNAQCSGKKAHVCALELLLPRPYDTLTTVTDKFSPCPGSKNLCFQKNLGGWEGFFVMCETLDLMGDKLFFSVIFIQTRWHLKRELRTGCRILEAGPSWVKFSSFRS